MNQNHSIAPTTDRNAKHIPINEDFLWGLHPVLAVLEESPDRVHEILLLQGRKGNKLEELIRKARENHIKVTFHSAFKISGKVDGELRHQGVFARVTAVPLLSLSQLVERFRERIEKGEKPRIIVCDSLQDPHNLGAIIRSAVASGACGVLTTRERSVPLGGTVAKASVGAVSSIDICQVTNLVNALKELKKAGAWVFGAVKESKAQSLYATDLRLPACIVVGSEGQGIRNLVQSECDFLVSIPMIGKLDSLNSSVAAAVILFEALRQNLQT